MVGYTAVRPPLIALLPLGGPPSCGTWSVGPRSCRRHLGQEKLPPPLPPLLLLCQNVGGNGKDNNKDGMDGCGGGDGDKDNGLTVVLLAVARPCFFWLARRGAPKNWRTTAKWGSPKWSFQDKPTYHISLRQICRI